MECGKQGECRRPEAPRTVSAAVDRLPAPRPVPQGAVVPRRRSIAAASQPPSAPREEAPAWKTWWFWTLVGGAAVVVGVTVPLLLRGEDTLLVRIRR